MRSIIGTIKLFFFGLLCTVIIPLQSLWVIIFGATPFYFWVPTLFNRLTCFIFRINVKKSGKPVSGHVIYVGNHLSYIDIPVLGGNLNATFISKADVKSWPVFGWLAVLSKTIFIERTRTAAASAISDIEKAVKKGRSLILFPEGTSTNGTNVLPFKSSVFDLFLSAGLKQNLVIQPFTLSISKINGKTPDTSKPHDIYAWYGDMKMLPHLWQLATSKGADILITFHPSRLAKNYDNRKIFASDCQKDVANGLETALLARRPVGT